MVWKIRSKSCGLAMNIKLAGVAAEHSVPPSYVLQTLLVPVPAVAQKEVE